MPEFAPSESKTAIAPITVSPSGLSCEAELFLGPDDMTKVVTSGRIPFTSTGVSQDVRLPIAMPAVEGTYHVYIDIYAEGILLAGYQALEDIVISPVGAPQFVYVSSVRRLPGTFYNSIGGGFYYALQIDIQNIGTAPGECYITGCYKAYHIRAGAWVTMSCEWYEYPNGEWYQEPAGRRHILQPGEVWTAEWWVGDFCGAAAYSHLVAWLESNAGKSEELVIC